jgi:hypothetical protein
MSRGQSAPSERLGRGNELGLMPTYRTVYARMCSQTHNDAEDTLNYFLVVSTGGV